MKNLSSENLCLYFVPLQMNNDDVVIVNKKTSTCYICNIRIQEEGQQATTWEMTSSFIQVLLTWTSTYGLNPRQSTR